MITIIILIQNEMLDMPDDLETRHAEMAKLRDDARERGLLDAAMIYGMSAMRITKERIEQMLKRDGKA